MKNTFITRLSKDIFSLGDKKKVISSSNKQRSSNQESVSIPDSVRIYEEICESLWNSEEEGNLCIDISNHPQKDFLKKNTPGFVSELIENRELLFFEKTYNKKKALENLLRERISSNEKIAIDSRKANEILDNLQTKSFRLKKGQIGAIESGLRSTFQIISGGPGTGKTTVIAFLLQTLKELNLLPQPEEIALVAPTGRAAQRLTESIQENLRKISVPEEKEYTGELFPDKNLKKETDIRFFRGETIHSLLSYKQYLGGFYYNRDRYLPHKLVIVDEVSMADLSLMLSLFQALPPCDHKNQPEAMFPFRFILIGDPNQLPSVEKGAVLGDFLSVLKKKGTHISQLTESNRQKESAKGTKSRIVTLAEDILNNDEGNDLNNISISQTFPRTSGMQEESEYSSEVVWLQCKTLSDSSKSRDNCSRDYILEELWRRQFLPQIERISGWNEMSREDLKKKEIYSRFMKESGEFRCLTIFRSGYFGVKAMQTKLMNFLRWDLNLENFGNRNRINSKQLSGQFYFSGMPILVTKNDKNRKLFNGDIGLVLTIRTHNDSGKPGAGKSNSELRAVFPIDNQLFDFALDTLPDHEPAFIMTVHKSQGSEYNNILLYLPDQNTTSEGEEKSGKLLNRQILYTAITRAKNQVILAGDPASWEEGIKKTNHRLTGFRI